MTFIALNLHQQTDSKVQQENDKNSKCGATEGGFTPRVGRLIQIWIQTVFEAVAMVRSHPFKLKNDVCT